MYLLPFLAELQCDTFVFYLHPPGFMSASRTATLLLINICRSTTFNRPMTVEMEVNGKSPTGCSCASCTAHEVFLASYLWVQTAQRSTVCGSTAVHHAATGRKRIMLPQNSSLCELVLLLMDDSAKLNLQQHKIKNCMNDCFLLLVVRLNIWKETLPTSQTKTYFLATASIWA